jgi:S1/P1 nuclease
VSQRWWVALVCALISLVGTRRAEAWNARGHMLIALVAYDALPEAQRAALVHLLEAHPRFQKDILGHLPADLDAAQRARWIFAQASTWPDLTRGQPEYEHGTWHYINWPLQLRHDGLVTCGQAQRHYPESLRRITALDAARRAQGNAGIPLGDFLPTALHDNRTTLQDPNAPAPARALALSWLLHLVADAHQPLHTVALFTPTAFVTGDRGGNDILVGGRGSLHRLWDGLLGDDTALASLDLGVRELRGDRRLSTAAESAARDLDTEHWLREGCEVARRDVYVPAILSSVSRFERSARAAGASVRPSERGSAPPRHGPSATTASAPAKPEVSPSPADLAAAAQTARARALRAGLRLATLLAKTPL